VQNDVILAILNPKFGRGRTENNFLVFTIVQDFSQLSNDGGGQKGPQSKSKCFMLQLGSFMSRSSVSILKMLKKFWLGFKFYRVTPLFRLVGQNLSYGTLIVTSFHQSYVPQ